MINNIDAITLEAEMNVLFALCDCYQKQAMILEYSTSEDVSEFSIFQESLLEREKGESKLKTVLLLPLRLIGSFVKLLKNFVRMCRDKIRHIRSKKKLGKLNPGGGSGKLKLVVKDDGTRYVTTSIDLEAVEYEINNFDVDNPDKNKLYSIDTRKSIEYKIDDYLSKLDKLCNAIEKGIIPKLNAKMDDYRVELDNVKQDTNNKSNRDKMIKIEKHITKLKNALTNWNNLVKRVSTELKSVEDVVKGEVVFESIDENAFRQAIRDKDYLALKVSTVSTMLDDPTFERGETMKAIHILKEQVPEIFEDEVKLDYEERLEKSAWDKRYFTKLTYWFEENFAISRINYIKEVGRVVHRDTAQHYRDSARYRQRTMSKDNNYEYFIPSNAFVNAIKNEDKIAIKAVLVGIIGTDPTFATTEYEEAIAYIKAKSEKMNGSALNLSEIYNKLDGEYELAKESWDEKYYHMLLVWYQDNYAEKRLNHIKAVGKEVYKNKSTLGKYKRNNRKK